MRQPVLAIVVIMVAVAAAVADAPLILFRQPSVCVMVVKILHVFAYAVIPPYPGKRRVLFPVCPPVARRVGSVPL
ncbi:hypothetical protein FNI11_22495 [Salmonella enterica subsp. salamae]|nr:hypothetical protein [Salmonella enterica subsp. salamae]ECJ2283601.1 hypothetical protein [Salmonella enterica subsp. salamae]